MIPQKYNFSEMNVEDNYDNSDNILVHNVFYAGYEVFPKIATIDDTIAIRFGAAIRKTDIKRLSPVVPVVVGIEDNWDNYDNKWCFHFAPLT